MLPFTPCPKPAPREKNARQPIERSGRPNAVNAPRKRQNFQRAYGGKARVEFVQGLDCIACVAGGYGVVVRPSQNAHIETGGMGRKSAAGKIVPLCRFHHAVLHRDGRGILEQYFRLNLTSEAAKVEAAWQSHTEGR